MGKAVGVGGVFLRARNPKGKFQEQLARSVKIEF